MKLSIKDGVFYVDNVFLCYCEAGNGRDDLQLTRCEVSTQFAHAHGKVLPDAVGLGWIGNHDECDIVLGSVRGSNGVIPSPSSVSVLLARLEVAESIGQRVTLEVME